MTGPPIENYSQCTKFSLVFGCVRHVVQGLLHTHVSRGLKTVQTKECANLQLQVTLMLQKC